MKYIVSFSGGKDSTAMLLRLLEEGRPVDDIVFCDTTAEFPRYTYLESGKVPFTLPRLNQVCKVLQIDPRQLLVFEEVADTFKQW